MSTCCPSSSIRTVAWPSHVSRPPLMWPASRGCDTLGHMGNGIELFWTLVCYAVVAGGAVLGGLVGYYWFVEIPRRELGH